MNKINFLAKDNFPLSSDGMDFMQQMIQLVSDFASIGGDNYILAGCDETDGVVSDGIIVINKEALPFHGGEKKSKIKIVEEKTTLVAFDVEYPESYINRYVIFDDSGEFNWSDYLKISTNKDLLNRIDGIKGDAPGTVKMWSGVIAKIPDLYKICDGAELLINDYPDLYENIGTSFGGDGISTFRLPDLRGRFVVGYDSAKTDYNALGKTGGKEEVTLTEAEMPPHKHEYGLYANGSTDLGRYSINANRDSDQKDMFDTSITGGEGGVVKPHENRPPFFTLAYIIKVKYDNLN